MGTLSAVDRWDGGADYDYFMGRWSRLVAARFVESLSARDGVRWLDVGCGTGALLDAVLDALHPAAATGVDPSAEFVMAARSRVGTRAVIHRADGAHLPFDDASFDVVVSGLALNFIPEPTAAVGEWKRVTVAGGTVAAYVWDYAAGMEFLRYFWDAAVALDPQAVELDEARRFPICDPDRLEELFLSAGLSAVETGSISVETSFSDFDDYWEPFLRGQGPAPGYVASLGAEGRRALEQRLRAALPVDTHGRLMLSAKAFTVAGVV